MLGVEQKRNGVHAGVASITAPAHLPERLDEPTKGACRNTREALRGLPNPLGYDCALAALARVQAQLVEAGAGANGNGTAQATAPQQLAGGLKALDAAIRHHLETMHGDDYAKVVAATDALNRLLDRLLPEPIAPKIS